MASLNREPPKRKMQVLYAGLPRSGSLSLCEALIILGYKAHHTIRVIGIPQFEKQWALLDKMSDKFFKAIPSYTGGEVTREEWEEIWAPYDAVTDISGSFTPWMLDAYPEAKVILVIRDYEKWRVSSESLIDIIFQPLSAAAAYIEKLITGSYITRASLKMMKGTFHGPDPKVMKDNLRQTYDDRHRMIRESIPAERLLVYTMGSGWEPLCEFLGKPIPDEKFLWVNENKALREKMTAMFREQILGGVVAVVPWMVSAVAVGFASWMVAKRYPVTLDTLPFLSWLK